MSQDNCEIRVEATGWITRAPEFGRTSAGVPVCRFEITVPVGPATKPRKKNVFVIGSADGDQNRDLAVRCHRGLHVGDRVSVPGIEHQRERKTRGVPWTEAALRAEDVKLRERASKNGSGA